MLRHYDIPRRKDGRPVFEYADKQLRNCLHDLWVIIPEEKVSLNEVETQFRRLAERALKNFMEDADQYKGHGGRTYK